MEDQIEQTPLEATPPAEALNTENVIPQSRFNKVITERNELRQRMAEMEQQQQDSRANELAEQSRWKELAEQRQVEVETLKVKAGQADSLALAFQQTLEARIEALPDNIKSFVPTHGTPQERSAWLDTNAASLTMPKAPDLGGGAGGRSTGEAALPKLTEMEKATADGFGMAHEEYAKLKAARQPADDGTELLDAQ